MRLTDHTRHTGRVRMPVRRMLLGTAFTLALAIATAPLTAAGSPVVRSAAGSVAEIEARLSASPR